MSTRSWCDRSGATLLVAGLAVLGSCVRDLPTDVTSPGAIPTAEVQGVYALAGSLQANPPPGSLFSGYALSALVELPFAGGVGSVSMSPTLSPQLVAAVVAAPGFVPRAAVVGDYRVVGLLQNITRAPAGSAPSVSHFFGLLGWNGINSIAQTVDNVLLVGSGGVSTFATTGANYSATIGGAGGGGGAFATRSPSAVFDATSGGFTASSWSVSGSQDCSQLVTATGFSQITCVVSTGQMSGSFSLVGAIRGGTGTVTFPLTSFTNVPLIVMTMSLAP